MTDYIVFKNPGDGLGWEELGHEEARSADSAIRGVLSIADNPDHGATYVAVPARSWKPVTVKVETKTALKFS